MNSRDYRVTPPPKDAGEEPLFRVVYAIDVNASDEQKAAETAWHMMRAKDAFDPILMVLDSEGKQTKLDLTDVLEFDKTTVGFVSQRYRKQNDGRFVCIFQEFIAGDQVQFGNIKDESIDPREHEYQPFNMTLLNSTQIIDRLRDALTSIDVGGEQSRQFAGEIEILTELLRDLGWSEG